MEAFVWDIETQQMSESLALLLRSRKVRLRELAEFQENTEGFVAALVLKNATKAEVKKLKSLFEAIGRVVDLSELGETEYISADNWRREKKRNNGKKEPSGLEEWVSWYKKLSRIPEGLLCESRSNASYLDFYARL